MIIGVPKEIKAQENRIAITPFGVENLTNLGHTVLLEHDGGVGCGLLDRDYENVGAKIITSSKEVFSRSELIVKVKEPQPQELDLVRDTGATAIAYETVQTSSGELPLLIPMSEVAGRMAIQEGAKILEISHGGRGVLLGGVPGVEPATVTILGAGVVGHNAAKIAAGMGANVYILDVSVNRLRYLDDIMPRNVTTLYSDPVTLRELLPRTDLLIGAVLVVGAKAPKLITRSMIKLMQPGSVIVDVAVDQGGCVETCRPTTHEDPTFVVDGVIHYCVTNMPGAVPNTSTRALTNSTYPYVEKIARWGAENAMLDDPALLQGLNAYKRQITHKGVAEAFDLEYVDPLTLLK